MKVYQEYVIYITKNIKLHLDEKTSRDSNELKQFQYQKVKYINRSEDISVSV